MTAQLPGNFQCAVEAVIVQDDKILVTKRSPNRDHKPNEWEMITGRVNQGESFIDALHREVFEETKLKVEIIQPIDTFHFDRLGIEMVGVSYWCKYLSGEVILDTTEQVEFRWVTPEEALMLIHIENIQKTIKSYQTMCGQCVVGDLITQTGEINTLFEKTGSVYDKKDRVMDLLEEAGELSQAILIVEKIKQTNDPRKQKTHADIADALSDILYALINIADLYKIDIFRDYQRMLLALEKRIKSGEFDRK